jgi:penicillin-binding protein 1A
VAIDNDTGEVRAMVGGRDYANQPFNLATQGQRQPGSSIKPFILATALSRGISPSSVWPSRKRVFTVPGTKGREKFVVNNFEDSYAGVNTLARALTVSDNAVYAAVGIQVGTRRIARLARRMGIRTPVSTNYAMTLGGLRQGVTPLDMAHAYETFAAGGMRVTGTLGTDQAGPVGIRSVTLEDKKRVVAENNVRKQRVLSPAVAQTATSIMQSVVQYGTGRRASLGTIFAAGKTGTTENSGDAWFVGFTHRLTVAVWVGYPQGFKPMKTEFGGEPVEGGTFPALIWHAFMSQAEDIYRAREDAARAKKGLPPLPVTPEVPEPPSTAVPPEGSQATPEVPTTTTPSGGGTVAPTTTTPTTTTPPSTPTTPTTTPTTTTPTPTTPSGGGTGGGGSTGGGSSGGGSSGGGSSGGGSGGTGAGGATPTP